MNYLIVNCGYTSRLLKHYAEMNPKPSFIWDKLWGEGLVNFDTPSEELETIKKLFPDQTDLSYGTIAFRYRDEEKFNIVKTVEMLGGFQHCAFFYINRNYWRGTEGIDDPPRRIKDSDLDNFVKDGPDYYCGTLYEVRRFQVKRTDTTVPMKVTYLVFDTESG